MLQPYEYVEMRPRTYIEQQRQSCLVEMFTNRRSLKKFKNMGRTMGWLSPGLRGKKVGMMLQIAGILRRQQCILSSDEPYTVHRHFISFFFLLYQAHNNKINSF